MLLLHLNHQVLFTALKCTKKYSRFSFNIMSNKANNLKDKLQSQFLSLCFVTYRGKIKENSTALKCFYIPSVLTLNSYDGPALRNEENVGNCFFGKTTSFYLICLHLENFKVVIDGRSFLVIGSFCRKY